MNRAASEGYGSEAFHEHLAACRDRDDVSDVWEGRVGRRLITEQYATWLVGLAPWLVFLTLTFRDEIPLDSAVRRFKLLVSVLNKSLLGKHYTRYVGHSYFSYVMAVEDQKRGVPHIHALTDKPLDFALIHAWWPVGSGFAWTSIVRDRGRSVWYVAKYVSKGGELVPYKASVDFTPVPPPVWWMVPGQDLKCVGSDAAGAEGPQSEAPRRDAGECDGDLRPGPAG